MVEEGLQTSIPDEAWSELLQSEVADQMVGLITFLLQPWGRDRNISIISFSIWFLCNNNSCPNQWQQRLRHHRDIREGSGLL